MDPFQTLITSIVRRGDGRQIHRLKLEIGLDSEIRFSAMPFGEEEAQLIDLSVLEIQPIQRDRLLDGVVNPSDVDDQLIVDEDPDVIVSTEREDLCA